MGHGATSQTQCLEADLSLVSPGTGGVRKGAFHFDEERPHGDTELCCDKVSLASISVNET